MDRSRAALRERRPCAALAEAHKAEVEVHYVTGEKKRTELLDELSGLLGEAGSACPCGYERSARSTRSSSGDRWNRG